MIDPVCLVHGLRRSEHVCLYCQLCYKSLTVEECSYLPDGTQHDVCVPCATHEQEMLIRAAKGLPPFDKSIPDDLDGGPGRELVSALTPIVNRVDERHQAEGGGTRHWIRDYFLPELSAAGWTIHRKSSS